VVVGSSLATTFDFVESALNSPIALGVFLLVLLIIDLSLVLQETQRSIARPLMDRMMWVTVFANEVNLVYKLIPLILPGSLLLAFGRSYRDSVECPDNTTLTRLVEGTLTIQLGPSYVFYYKFEELFPEKATKHLVEEMKDYLRRAQPAAVVGVHEGSCVLIAYASKSDVRRVDLWTQSNALTANLVTKSRSVITSLRPYEEI
jgi:hypothetical protein